MGDEHHGTASPGARPRWSMEARLIPSSRSTPVTSAITPGWSSTISRR
jgi:hypothetical protein